MSIAPSKAMPAVPELPDHLPDHLELPEENGKNVSGPIASSGGPNSLQPSCASWESTRRQSSRIPRSSHERRQQYIARGRIAFGLTGSLAAL
jgi:hypothetical protein